MKGTYQARHSRFGLSDLFLILLLLLCIGGAGLRAWNLRAMESADLQTYEVLAEWKNVDVRTADCLREGDILYTAAGEVFGTVAALERLPSVARVTEAGVLYESELPENIRCDVRVRIMVEGRISGGALLRNGTVSLAVGESCRLYSDRVEASVRVLFCPTSPPL